MQYNIEENKITIYRFSLLYKCLIALIFFMVFFPFIYWLIMSKTLIQKIIMIFAVIIFVFGIPLIVLLSNKKIEILKEEGIVKITTYLYKYFRVKTIKFNEILAVHIKPIMRRKQNYVKKWWQVYLMQNDKKAISLHFASSANEAQEIAVKTGKILEVNIINEESKDTLDYNMFDKESIYIDKIIQNEAKLKELERPKNIYKDDYGKRVIFRWFNIKSVEFTLMFLIFYLLVFLDILLYKRNNFMFAASLKLTLFFMVYFLLRYLWFIFINNGWCEMNNKAILIRKNIFLFPKVITILWSDIQDILIESEYYIKLVFKTKDKTISINFTKDKIYWFKNEINNYIRSHF